MFKNTVLKFLSIMLLFTTILFGCKSKFEKLRASNDTAKKYQEALRLYNKENYSKALILFDELFQKYKGMAEAEDLSYYYAYTNYKLRDYTTARYQFKTFADTYPTSARAEESRYMSAYCFYLESPTFSLDQENTLKAIESLQLFINLYPKSERVKEASKLIDDLRDKLETKSYANAKLYLDIGDYKSAVIAFENSIRDFPDTKYAEEMEFLTIKAQYLYAKNSYEYLQEERFTKSTGLYNAFIEDYPKSAYLKEGEALKKDAEAQIVQVKKLLATAQQNQKGTKDTVENKTKKND